MTVAGGPVVALGVPAAARDPRLEAEGVIHVECGAETRCDESVIDDCVVTKDRITALGPRAAAIRDGGEPVHVCLSAGAPVADHPVRMLFDAGFRVVFRPGSEGLRHELALAQQHHAFTDVELAACVERAAGAAALPDDEREQLVAAVTAGWNARPARLVHLAEREMWDAQRTQGSYLPAEWERDGFIHLSALHQLLTPANKFYRGREDLVALVIDAHLLGAGVIWEAGTGTVERFPHLYSSLTPDAVLGEVAMTPEPDGGFFLPPELIRAMRSPLGR